MDGLTELWARLSAIHFTPRGLTLLLVILAIEAAIVVPLFRVLRRLVRELNEDA